MKIKFEFKYLMNKFWLNSKNWVIDNPSRFFLITLIVLTLILGFLDYKSQFLITGSTEQKEYDWRGILTEIHGMWFDILILGLLLTLYERLRIKKEVERELESKRQEKINIYNTQIDAFVFTKQPTNKIYGT